MLKTRIITAAILIPLMLLVIFYLPVGVFCVLTGLITLMAGWEWTRLMGLKTNLYRFNYLAIILVLCIMMLFISIPLTMMIAAVWWLLAMFMVAL